jgi:hypothetical protein
MQRYAVLVNVANIVNRDIFKKGRNRKFYEHFYYVSLEAKNNTGAMQCLSSLAQKGRREALLHL